MTGSIALPVLIATAARAEAHPLLAVSAVTDVTEGCLGLDGALADVSLLVAGVGRAGDPVLARALAELQPRTVINLGYAGALDPSLAAGDAVISRCEILAPALGPDPTLPGAPSSVVAWVQTALHDRGVVPRVGPLLTVEQPFHDRRAQAERLGASGALAVEMESARWARLAAAARADFVSLRVISDRADLRLPELRHRLLRPNGDVRWGRWLGALARTGGIRQPLRELAKLRHAQLDWIAAGGGLERVCAALLSALEAETSPRPS